MFWDKKVKNGVWKNKGKSSGLFSCRPCREFRVIPGLVPCGPLKEFNFSGTGPSNWLLAIGILIRNTPLVPSGTVADRGVHLTAILSKTAFFSRKVQTKQTNTTEQTQQTQQTQQTEQTRQTRQTGQDEETLGGRRPQDPPFSQDSRPF